MITETLGLTEQAQIIRTKRVTAPNRCSFARGLFRRANGRAFHSEEIMNTDQVKGAVKDTAGKIRPQAGDVVGCKSQQAKGLEKQVEGKAQKALGDIKNTAKK